MRGCLRRLLFVAEISGQPNVQGKVAREELNRQTHDGERVCVCSYQHSLTMNNIATTNNNNKHPATKPSVFMSCTRLE